MKKTLALAGAGFAAILNSTIAFAHCPLCTAAVGAGVAVSRFYGVDDTIVGVWIGAFVVSTALWFGRAIKKQYVPQQGIALQVIALALTVVPFYTAGIIGHPGYTLYGIDKLLLGIITGSIMTNIAMLASTAIKKSKGKVLFPFQTIAIILATLTLSSAAFWTMVRVAAA